MCLPEYEVVRRRVANNLNDIAKDNNDAVVQIVTQWLGHNAQEHITRHQSFKVISTRVFHLGRHKWAIIINGQESTISTEKEALVSFELTS